MTLIFSIIYKIEYLQIIPPSEMLYWLKITQINKRLKYLIPEKIKKNYLQLSKSNKIFNL